MIDGEVYSVNSAGTIRLFKTIDDGQIILDFYFPDAEYIQIVLMIDVYQWGLVILW